jgi:hypothetical protein
MAAARISHGHFEKYAFARLQFVRSVADMAEHQEYLEVGTISFIETVKTECHLAYYRSH